MKQFKNTVRPVVLSAQVVKLLLKISITDLFAYCIFIGYLSYKFLIFCVCWLFGVNILSIWTTLPYYSNSAIQGGCQFLLQILLLICMCIEYYKVLIFCLCGSFVVNILLMLTTLPYGSNSAIQGSFQLYLKLSITGLDVYFTFVESLRYKFLIFFCADHLAEITYWYELLLHIIPTPPNEQASSFLYSCTVISVGITFHEPLPCDLSRKSKYQAILTFHNNLKNDRPYKSTLSRGVSSSVPTLHSFRGVFLIPFLYLLLFFPPIITLYFSAALAASVIHFSVMKILTLYWWQ